MALTYQYEVAENGTERIRTEPGQKLPPRATPHAEPSGAAADPGKEEVDDDEDDEDDSSDESDAVEDAEAAEAASEEVIEANQNESTPEPLDPPQADSMAEGGPAPPISSTSPEAPALETQGGGVMPVNPNDEDSESDGGEWITPSNLAVHRSHDLGLLPDEGPGRSGAPPEVLAAACMTGDYAVQNVLLGIGLGLVGEGGKRIAKVRSWVLRCHACFK